MDLRVEIITAAARCDIDGLANLLDGRRVEEDAPAPTTKRGYLQKFRTGDTARKRYCALEHTTFSYRDKESGSKPSLSVRLRGDGVATASVRREQGLGFELASPALVSARNTQGLLHFVADDEADLVGWLDAFRRALRPPTVDVDARGAALRAAVSEDGTALHELALLDHDDPLLLATAAWLCAFGGPALVGAKDAAGRTAAELAEGSALGDLLHRRSAAAEDGGRAKAAVACATRLAYAALKHQRPLDDVFGGRYLSVLFRSCDDPTATHLVVSVRARDGPLVAPPAVLADVAAVDADAVHWCALWHAPAPLDRAEPGCTVAVDVKRGAETLARRSFALDDVINGALHGPVAFGPLRCELCVSAGPPGKNAFASALRAEVAARGAALAEALALDHAEKAAATKHQKHLLLEKAVLSRLFRQLPPPPPPDTPPPPGPPPPAAAHAPLPPSLADKVAAGDATAAERAANRKAKLEEADMLPDWLDATGLDDLCDIATINDMLRRDSI